MNNEGGKISKIIIVDDDEDLRILLKKYLALQGHEIINTIEDGVQLIENLHALPVVPDLIIMDYHMPSKDGYETLKELKNFNAKINVIIISGDPSVREKVLSAGAVAFHSKNESFKNLVEIIRKVESNIL